MRKITGLIVVLFVCAAEAPASDRKAEFLGAYWILDVAGSVRSGAGALDLDSDLGIRGRKWMILAKGYYKPSRKHRFHFEFVPYRLVGANRLPRTAGFAGTAFQAGEALTTRANVNYFFGGYQYDFVNRERGHFGVLGGLSYFHSRIRLESSPVVRVASDTRSLPLPLAGAGFRVYPLRASNLLNINGDFKGMSLGSYGHYAQGSINAGIGIGRRITLQVGYALLDLDLHDKPGTRAVELRFKGPIFSLQLGDK